MTPPPPKEPAAHHGDEGPIAELLRFIKGWTDSEQKRHKGMLERLEDLEEVLARQDAQRLTWKNGLGIAAAGGLLSQCFAWFGSHLK